MFALVTGGSGFLGGAIARRLLERGDRVRVLQRSEVPALARLGAEVVRGDISSYTAVLEACRGVEAVFHTAAKAGVWGPAADYEKANVAGTRNIVAACRQLSIPRLIYTSTPSVVFDGHDAAGGSGELVPHAERFYNHYQRTKCEAEILVREANEGAVATVALRPHLIWGPGDPHLVPRILARARAGKLRIVGTGKNLVDSTYIDNAVEAHVAAADHLDLDARCAGRAYFIANGEPIPMAELLSRILAAAGLGPVQKSLSLPAAYLLGAGLELLHRMLRIRREPLMTRFVALQLARCHWYDPRHARRDLGYEPRVRLAEAFERLAASLQGVRT